MPGVRPKPQTPSRSASDISRSADTPDQIFFATRPSGLAYGLRYGSHAFALHVRSGIVAARSGDSRRSPDHGPRSRPSARRVIVCGGRRHAWRPARRAPGPSAPFAVAGADATCSHRPVWSSTCSRASMRPTPLQPEAADLRPRGSGPWRQAPRPGRTGWTSVVPGKAAAQHLRRARDSVAVGASSPPDRASACICGSKWSRWACRTAITLCTRAACTAPGERGHHDRLRQARAVRRSSRRRVHARGPSRSDRRCPHHACRRDRCAAARARCRTGGARCHRPATTCPGHGSRPHRPRRCGRGRCGPAR